MKYGFRAPRPKKLYHLLYQYVFTLSTKHINIIGFIFIVKTWVIGQKVCVTNPNKLENL